MYRVTQFSPDHVRQAQLRNEDNEVMWGLPNWNDLLATYAAHYAVTLWHGDAWVASGGCIILWPGVGEAWAVAGPEIPRHGSQVLKMTKQFLSTTERLFLLRRIQATIISARVEWIRFARSLGFKREGTMFGYGPDCKDYELMARYRGWDRQ